jgi:hypothetical protein
MAGTHSPQLASSAAAHTERITVLLPEMYVIVCTGVCNKEMGLQW